MSNLSSQSFDQQSNIIDENNFENDDLITFKHNSKTINLYFSQIIKYSKHVRDSYLFMDAPNRFPQKIQQLQDEFQLIPENIDFFFQLLQENYNIKEESNITYTQCVDLLKISKHLEVRKLTFKINQYIKSRSNDVEFVLQMLEYNIKTQKVNENQEIEISKELETILSNKINECFSNEKFKEFPIQIIYRILRKSSPKIINNNKLFDIIIKSLSKFCVLFPFLDLQKLSEDRLEELCEMYSKSDENTQQYFDYLKCNLNLIKEMNNHKQNLEEMNIEHQNKLNELEKLLQNQMNEQQNKVKDLESKIASLQSKFNASENANVQLQNQLNDSKSLINEQQNKMKDLELLLQKQFNEQLQIKFNEFENQISQLQDKFTTSEKEIVENNKLVPFEGQIVANVEKEIFINAEINLIIKHGILDTTKSKVIISTSDAKNLGSEAYEKGRPITSLHMNTTFACKIGLYYVRCIVFNTEGESNEIVSNSVTTSGSCLTFDYNKGEPVKISLPQGQYILEVWGAKGGDSTGNGYSNSDRCKTSKVQGGLGGYSRGTLSLNKKETVYVLVGEEGRPSNSSKGSSTKGGFPDGGGTQTGHYSDCTTVPGTGGGSTSIRIGSNTDYNRVIVAGGGGGASGCSYDINPGGFGGGPSGGNCYHRGSLQSQGAGTQKGSTCGIGLNSHKEDPGEFGKGATFKNINDGFDSGGGGGGGWYGGGSGGSGGHIYSGSGGGGSGWTFTELSLKEFQSGDSANASKFALNNMYYLTDTKCIGGNEEFPRPDGNGNEQGHAGNGYAKITPL